MIKRRSLALPQRRISFQSISLYPEKPSIFKGSYISHKILDTIEKRTNYYSSLCSKYTNSPQKNTINYLNLSRSPAFTKLQPLKKKLAQDVEFKIRHARGHSDFSPSTKSNIKIPIQIHRLL